MSEAQFDEIFKKLEEVLFDIIKNNNCQTITSSEFYDKFNSKQQNTFERDFDKAVKKISSLTSEKKKKN